MSKDYPRLFKIPNRKIDDQYYLCHNVEDVLNAAIEGYNTLREMGLLYEMEKPDPDRYGEVTDEMIENAPSDLVREALRKTKNLRYEWLSGNHPWDGKSLEHHQRLYSLFLEAEKGNKKAAYNYLKDMELMNEIDYNQV